MKTSQIITCMLVSALPLMTNAQNKGKSASVKTKTKTSTTTTTIKTKPAAPVWSLSQGYGGEQPVYFQDYYTFYEPSRGYTYWSNGGWKSSPTPPSFLSKVDLGKARIQILKGLTLDMHPEQNYPNYMKLYPARQTGNDVPVPAVTR